MVHRGLVPAARPEMSQTPAGQDTTRQHGDSSMNKRTNLLASFAMLMMMAGTSNAFHDTIEFEVIGAGPGNDKRGRVGNVHDQAGSSGRPDTASRGGRRAGKRQVRCELSQHEHRNSKRRHHLAGSARIRELRLSGDRTGLHRRADVHGNRRWSARRSVQHRNIRIPA